ncbi:hypothetical protein MAR_024036 [Mya arenaria]|uniref:C1q domain-containing protein n=1 Tax=Mya arenaria TaxID=6604 RepID=A0ABY7DRD0_MYAAR|nr:uncharacterized protein LOC128229018 [Mya arenaria]WAQ99663.1 hypothetical protein MAR_024036 [Mya arenaria]
MKRILKETEGQFYSTKKTVKIMDRAKVAVLLCFLILHPASSLQDEPMFPTKFQYDEQLLEKVIRMELKFEEYEKKLDNAIELLNKSILDVNKSIVDGTDELKELESQIERKHEQIESTVNGKLQEFDHLADELRIPNVFFRAEYPTDLSNPNPIVFTKTVYDFGNGYDNVTGVFTVPVDGTYLFTMHLCSHAGKDIHYRLTIDDEDHLGGRNFNTGSHVCTSADVIAPLKTNSKVFVKSSQSSDVLYEDGSYRRNIFSGVLLHK